MQKQGQLGKNIELREGKKRGYIRVRKWQYESRQIQEMDELQAKGEISIGKLNNAKEYKPQIAMCNSGSGEFVSDKPRVLESWTEHFKLLLNGGGDKVDEADDQHEETETASPEEEILQIENVTDAPSLDEVEAIEKLENNKAPGSDEMPAELVKYGGDSLYSFLHNLISDVWENEVMP